MADHLIKEQRGAGEEYRRSTLQAFSNSVNYENDFPLNKFISRHDAPSSSIGYGKAMMMWQMLRRKLGDENFLKGIQLFYENNKYKTASYADMQIAMEEASGIDLTSFFDQWVNRTGAPELQLSGIERKRNDKSYTLSFTLSQVQSEEPFILQVPAAITFADETVIQKVELKKRQQTYTLNFDKKPLLLQIDPQFQLFRRLHPNEIPPSLSKIFGAGKLLMLLPSQASKEEQDGYRRLAAMWSKDPSKQIELKMDNEIKSLPADRAVWIFGVQNAFRTVVEKGLTNYNTKINNDEITIGKTVLSAKQNSLVISMRHPNNPGSVVVWLTASTNEAIPGLARKLPHYGKYSYLAFEGDEPANTAKGQWPSVNSPLTFQISLSGTPQAHLKKRPALAQIAPVFSAERMMADIRFLADKKLKGRGLGMPELEQAADYIAGQFKKAGLKPGADDGTYFQTWQDVVNARGAKGTVKNIIGILPGTNPKMAGESVVVSAHYDHLGLGWPDVRKGNEGKIHPGADDNASGIAVMLELARIMAKAGNPQRTIVFVAFTAEENGLIGSAYYVKHYKKYPAAKVIGDINLDTVGRLGKNKLMVLNSSTARDWKFIFMGAGYVTGVESEMITQQLDASDQGSFIAAGIPAVQIFSGAHRDYHRPSDTIDKIDPSGLVKTAAFTREAIAHLAERENPMPFTGKVSAHPASRRKTSGSTRSVTTGSMPDFSYTGKGVRIADAGTDSPAAKAGLQKGDIIIQLGETKIASLRDYANALKNYKSGDEAIIKYLRAGKEQTAKIKLSAR